MTEKQVIDLLGPPKSRPSADFTGTDDPYQMYGWEYGELQFKSDAFPEPMLFQLYFTRRKVAMIEDPFGHVAPGTGPPTAPELLCPFNGAAFGHYPRYLDLRWRPCPGDGIKYDIEVDFEDSEFRPLIKSTSQIPYFAAVFCGKQTGRWRVRATNKHGIGDWSEFRTFAFGV